MKESPTVSYTTLQYKRNRKSAMFIRLVLHFCEFENLIKFEEMFVPVSIYLGFLEWESQALDILVTYLTSLIKCLEEEEV